MTRVYVGQRAGRPARVKSERSSSAERIQRSAGDPEAEEHKEEAA
jgi:hypothetical protein